MVQNLHFLTRGPQVGFTVGHLWSYPSIFFIGIPARTGHSLTGENVVSFSEVFNTFLVARKFSTGSRQQDTTGSKNRVFGVFTSGKSPTFSGAFGANRTWCILEKVPKFWIFGLSPKATPFAKYPQIFLKLDSNNYLFFI